MNTNNNPDLDIPSPPGKLSQERNNLSQLIEYVRVLIEMADKPVWSVSSYNNLLLTEQDLRNRVGIRHDLRDADGSVYLKIERLRRIDPPEPPPEAKEWLTVGRDPYVEPLVETLRTSVMSAIEVAKHVAAGSVDSADVSRALKPKPGEDLCDVIFRLDRFPDAKSAVETYVTRTWPEWSASEKPRRETIDIYERVFSLQQALKLEGSERPLEVVWGMGVARWKLPPNELDHPLVEQLVELELDEAGAILVRPRSLDPLVALKPYTAMENPGVDLVARFAREHFSGNGSEEEISPFVKDTYTPILRYACAQFDKSGRYHPDVASPEDRAVPAAGPNLLITDTWALYARPRSDNFFTADLIRLKEAVESGETLPPPAVALVTPPSDEITYATSLGVFSAGGMAAGMGYAPSIPNQEEADQTQFFFPKAFNEEQIAIVQRLEDPSVEGVVVQGPPGTGKTHTIANIICHYLATGRRVLVTSKSEGALAVLRDQIPDGIRDLVISLLTSEREGLKQLETTVNVLASKIASLDTRSTERDVRDSEARIVELQGRIAKIDAEMREFADKHLRRVGATKDSDGVLPIELAERIVRDRDRYDWFTDRPSFATSAHPQFRVEDIHAARGARNTLGGDLDYLNKDLPSSSDLPDPASMGAIHQDLANAARIERDRSINAPIMSSSEQDALSRARILLSAIEALASVQRSCAAEKWLETLLTEWRRGGLDAESARPLALLFSEMRDVIRKRAEISSLGVTVPDGAYGNPELVSAVERASSGQKPFGLIGWGQSELRAAFNSIRVLDVPAQSPAQWKSVLDVLLWERGMASTLARWRALAPEFLLPELPSSFGEAARALNVHIGNAAAVAEAVRIHIPSILTEVPRLFPYGLSADSIIDQQQMANEAAESIRSEISRHQLLGTLTKLNGIKATLERHTGRISDRLRAFLNEIGLPDISPNATSDRWRELIAELDRVRGLRGLLQTVTNVSNQVSESGAPKWATALRTIPVASTDDPWTPEDWRDAWTWAQAEAHLRAIDGRTRLSELDNQRRASDDEMRRLFQNVVRLRTLLTLRARITRKVDAALQMFLTAIRKIGKGTGKSASRLRRDARDAMESSYAAVPCWIMPSWRISESLPSTLASFDLVIIDEASQSDISALPAVLRAKKVLVVGDDKQVSPTAAFIEEQKIRSLRMHYLDGQHFGALMLPGNSLYELALACFPGRRIMLREHFRCVEPIIRFSFQFYTDEIIPVRVPKASERLSPPLIDVHVTNGRKDKSNRNFAEAEAIVDEVAKIVADPTMVQRSIGIISLIGAKQAVLIQSLLLKRIGEEAYVRHDIACGDSAMFQGKERDVILLSMVECPETRTSKTALALQQRFNVALSRARDRQYLFRSVTEEMLKPDDLKAKVLRHFKSPMEGRSRVVGDDLMALCDSGFERDVLSRLIKLGYRVQPQVSVGPYSIDMVVEGRDDRRLAVELDGDKYHGPEKWAEDLARQRVMERVGWRFWRCWGSSYRIDPDGCIDDLIGSLSSLNIEPIGNDREPNIWTEFRKYPAAGEQYAHLDSDRLDSAPRTGGSDDALAEEGQVVRIGSRVQVQVGEDHRIRFLTLSAERHDPTLGIISARHPSGIALLGSEEDDEIEFVLDGKTHKWMVLHIEKSGEHYVA